MRFEIYNDKNKQLIEFSISNCLSNYYKTYKKSSKININFQFWIPRLIKNCEMYIVSSNNIQIPKNSFYIYIKQNNNSKCSFICILNFFKKYEFSDAVLINFGSDFLDFYLCFPSDLRQLISKFEKLFMILKEFENISLDFPELVKKTLELKLILDKNENFLHLDSEFDFNNSINEIQMLNEFFKKIINFIDKISLDFKFDKFESSILKNSDEILPLKIKFGISASNKSKIKIQDLATKLNSILNCFIPHYLLINHQVSNPYVEIVFSDNFHSIIIDSEEFFKDIKKSVKVIKFLNLEFVKQFKSIILLNQLSKKEFEFFYLLSERFSKEFNRIENFLKILEL